MIAILEIVLESFDYDFKSNLAKTKFRSLQSYLDPIVTKIAIIFSPHGNFDCNYTWSLS